jgi:anti-sigma factor RsiW
MTCRNTIPWATLVDYWAGDLDDVETGALDEHLFGCPECTATSARVAAVTEAVRGILPVVVSRQQIDRLRARGARVHENDFLPGDRRQVRFAPDVDLLIHRLGGLDLTGAARVAVRITSESTGALVADAESVPFDPTEGTLLVACHQHYATLPHDTVMTVAIHLPDLPPRTATYTILHEFERRAR